MAKGRDSGMPPAEQWEGYFQADGVLQELGCGAPAVDAAEFGCGYGTFSMAAARRISGTLYATDIEPAMIEATMRRASREGVRNVVAERRDFISQGCGRPDESVDFALLFNILHIETPVSLLREALRVARPGGIVGVIHWRRDIDTPRGPPLDIRPSPQQCRAWAEAAGLSWVRDADLAAAPWHWGMTLRRPAPAR